MNAVGRYAIILDAMSVTVQKIAAEIEALPEEEFDQLLRWLAEYRRSQDHPWELELEQDSQPGGRLETVLNRVRADISEGRTRPLSEVVHDS